MTTSTTAPAARRSLKHWPGGVLAGVGDEFADHQPGQVHRASGHRQTVLGLDAGEEVDRAVRCLSEHVPVVLQGDGVQYPMGVRHHVGRILGY
ncbi:hypothetical protein [Streptomyces phaeoluteigriseus]|uniref:hypothetical protein n=1 Tax=Streptomyces phaeoluteigriseus TaxID=114686 RepID=UPI00338DE32A